MKAHLIAKSLGGSGRERGNIVPIGGAANDAMKDCEMQISNKVQNGQIVWYVVVPNFQGENLVPYSITLYARGNRGYSLSEVIPNPYRYLGPSQCP